MKYAGIGSRETPLKVLEQMEQLAKELSAKGYTLRSGGALGADTAFAKGSNNSEIYLPWAGYNNVRNGLLDPHDSAIVRARNAVTNLHPAPHRLSQGAWKLHMRNVYIMVGYGEELDPVDFVICWTKDGKATGGTGMAIRIAESQDIPIFNLYHLDAVERLNEFLKG